MDKAGLIILSFAPFLIFIFPLPVALPGFLRFPSLLRSQFLTLRSRGLLLRLCSSRLLPLLLHRRGFLLLLWLRCRGFLLPLLLHWRSFLLLLLLHRRGFLLPLLLHRRGFLLLLLLHCRCSLLRSGLFFPLNRCGRSLFYPRLDLLADYLVPRLVTVILVA
jgi:hypothetical protein